MTDLAKQIDLITSKLSEQLDSLESEYQRWNNYKNDYDALEQQLKTLPDETKKSAMIPLGKLAFMPGTIVHTNEILVLLGEQYFAERSAKQALEILDRRREVVVENLRLVEAQLNSYKAKSDSINSNVLPSDQVNEEGLPIMEIREELPPIDEKQKQPIQQETPKTLADNELPESVVRARKMMKEADEKIKQNKQNDDNKALFDLLRQLEEEEEEEAEETTTDKPVVVEKPVKRVKFQDQEDEEEDDEDDYEDFSDDDDDEDGRYDRDISESMFDRFADDDEEYAEDGVVDQEDFTVYEETQPPVKSTPPTKVEPPTQPAPKAESSKIRSPGDIFKAVKSAQDGYPVMDDDEESAQFNLSDLVEAARQIASEPIYRTTDGTIPIMKPTTPDPNGILVTNKTKLDNKIMKGAVMERETAPVDLEEVEQDMDFREVMSEYQQKRQNMVAATGGFSFTPKPEFEVVEEELPLPKKGKQKEEEEEAPPPPKKMSRFKAARLGIQFE